MKRCAEGKALLFVVWSRVEPQSQYTENGGKRRLEDERRCEYEVRENDGKKEGRLGKANDSEIIREEGKCKKNKKTRYNFLLHTHFLLQKPIAAYESVLPYLCLPRCRSSDSSYIY